MVRFPRLKTKCAGSRRTSIVPLRAFRRTASMRLVWGLSELLVEPIASEGIFELYRQQAAALAAKKAAEAEARRVKPNPAPGSVEWQRLQSQNQ